MHHRIFILESAQPNRKSPIPGSAQPREGERERGRKTKKREREGPEEKKRERHKHGKRERERSFLFFDTSDRTLGAVGEYLTSQARPCHGLKAHNHAGIGIIDEATRPDMLHDVAMIMPEQHPPVVDVVTTVP